MPPGWSLASPSKRRSLDENLPLGWLVSVTGYVADRIGITAEANGSYKSIDLGFDQLDLSVLSFMGGVKLTADQERKAIPYFQSLAGVVRQSAGIADVGESELDFGVLEGAGVDVKISEKLAIRFGGDYRLIFSEGSVSEFRFHIGISYRYGSR